MHFTIVDTLHVKKAYGGLELQLHVFLNLLLYESVCSPSYHGRSTSSDNANSTQRIKISVGLIPGLETGQNTNICPVSGNVVPSL